MRHLLPSPGSRLPVLRNPPGLASPGVSLTAGRRRQRRWEPETQTSQAQKAPLPGRAGLGAAVTCRRTAARTGAPPPALPRRSLRAPPGPRRSSARRRSRAALAGPRRLPGAPRCMRAPQARGARRAPRDRAPPPSRARVERAPRAARTPETELYYLTPSRASSSPGVQTAFRHHQSRIFFPSP